ncbi:hypothetical protein BASA83_006255 [Batrachochytrium salamandrivorans]|nr:hypothetical protein BASA83_006255 [Batrachochytrium salamandrivorans]
MQSNTINFNATVCFSFDLTVTPVTRGGPSGSPSAANIHLDGQFQFSASIRFLPNPLVSDPFPLSVSPSRTTDLGFSSYDVSPIASIASIAPVASISPIASVASIFPVVPAVAPVSPVVPIVPVVPAVPAVVPTVSIAPIIPFPPVLAATSAQDCAVGAILPVAMLAPVDTTPANPCWLKKAMRNDRPFWESPRRSSKRVIPPVRARVHPDSVPEDWVTTYIDNAPRLFYYPMIRE